MIPQEINAFFSTYPNAKKVYFTDETGRFYLNNFADDALADARTLQEKLKTWDGSTFGDGGYPTAFLYQIVYDGSGAGEDDTDGWIDEVVIGTEVKTVDEYTAEAMRVALEDALISSGITYQSIEVTEASSRVMAIKIIASSDTTVDIKDKGGNTHSLIQTFS